VGRPRTRWTDYIEDLGWNRLGLQPSEMLAAVADRDVWRLNLELLPPQPYGHERALKEEEDKNAFLDSYAVFTLSGFENQERNLTFV